ncbi:MAG: aldo/keto reductase [Ignavibacteriaceae bacterium]
MPDTNSAIKDITKYIYGTTRLGDKNIPYEERINIARAAMNSGVWFHTSRMYGDALEVLGEVFAEEPGKVPKLIIKIEGTNIKEFRASVDENLVPMGLKELQLAQLCLGGGLAEEFANGGDCYKVFRDIKNEGLVKGYVCEVFPWTSTGPLKGLREGYTEGIVDAFIFYLNPLQRFASNILWDELVNRKQNIISMRTVAGGPVHSMRDVPGFAWKDYLQKRAVEVAPVFERSGIASWTEFCVRFAHSFPQVIATVGSTGKIKNLDEFLAAKENPEPLPEAIVSEIKALQQRWSDELDIHAEPWTM